MRRENEVYCYSNIFSLHDYFFSLLSLFSESKFPMWISAPGRMFSVLLWPLYYWWAVMGRVCSPPQLSLPLSLFRSLYFLPTSQKNHQSTFICIQIDSEWLSFKILQFSTSRAALRMIAALMKRSLKMLFLIEVPAILSRNSTAAVAYSKSVCNSTVHCFFLTFSKNLTSEKLEKKHFVARCFHLDMVVLRAFRFLLSKS